MTYTSRSPEYAADLAEIVAAYKARGLGAASERCNDIAEARCLSASERLTLADGFRRRIILGGC